MSVQERLYTNEEFWEFGEHNPDGWYELLDGVIYEMPSPTPLHGLVSARIPYLLMVYLANHDLGYAIGDANDFALAPGVVLKPDAAFVAKAKLKKLPPKHYNFPPDLAIEVVSLGNKPDILLNKIETFLHYGTRLVWVIYPTERSVRVYRPETNGSLNMRKITADEPLDGGDVLPGFQVLVRDLFPQIEMANE